MDKNHFKGEKKEEVKKEIEKVKERSKEINTSDVTVVNDLVTITQNSIFYY